MELDRPELYERYLSMKFRDFMDWYWNVNGAKELGKRMPVPERIYVGNAFCHLLFPEKRQLFEIFKKAESEGLAVTVIFSYLREFMLKPVEKLLDELEDVKKQQNEERVAQEGVKKDIEGIQTQIDIAKNEEEKKTMIHKELANDMTRVHDKWTQTKSTYELHSKAVLALQQENEGIKSQHAELLEVIHSLTTRSTQLQQTLLEKESVVRETIGAGNQEMLTHLKQKRKDLETYCVSLGTELETSRLEEALSTMKKEKEEIEKEVQKLSSSSKESRITDEDMKGLFDRKRQLEKELYSLQTTPIDVGNDPEIHSVSND